MSSSPFRSSIVRACGSFLSNDEWRLREAEFTKERLDGRDDVVEDDAAVRLAMVAGEVPAEQLNDALKRRALACTERARTQCANQK